MMQYPVCNLSNIKMIDNARDTPPTRSRCINDINKYFQVMPERYMCLMDVGDCRDHYHAIGWAFEVGSKAEHPYKYNCEAQ